MMFVYSPPSLTYLLTGKGIDIDLTEIRKRLQHQKQCIISTTLSAALLLEVALHHLSTFCSLTLVTRYTGGQSNKGVI